MINVFIMSFKSIFEKIVYSSIIVDFRYCICIRLLLFFITFFNYHHRNVFFFLKRYEWYKPFLALYMRNYIGLRY